MEVRDWKINVIKLFFFAPTYNDWKQECQSIIQINVRLVIVGCIQKLHQEEIIQYDCNNRPDNTKADVTRKFLPFDLFE